MHRRPAIPFTHSDDRQLVQAHARQCACVGRRVQAPRADGLTPADTARSVAPLRPEAPTKQDRAYKVIEEGDKDNNCVERRREMEEASGELR